MTSLTARCRGLLDGPTLIVYLAATGTPITDQVLRKWASRGAIRRHGTDDAGRVLYDVGEVARQARTYRQRAVARGAA